MGAWYLAQGYLDAALGGVFAALPTSRTPHMFGPHPVPLQTAAASPKIPELPSTLLNNTGIQILFICPTTGTFVCGANACGLSGGQTIPDSRHTGVGSQAPHVYTKATSWKHSIEV